MHDHSDNSELDSDVESGMLVDSNHRANQIHEIYDDVLFEKHLLDGLPNWLDRLFEGTTTRYYINYWPEHMK